MNRIEELAILWDTVRNNTRHKYYDRTVELAEKYYRFVTGDGLDKDMVQFVRREDATMFQQRKDITKHIIPTVVKNLMDVQYKVPRSNSLTRKLEYTGDKQGTKAEKLEGILAKFWGDKSFDDYMGTRTVELNNTDPNTFVVTEFKDFDATQEHLQPYPFESSSEMSVNYEVDNNILQWLIVLQAIFFVGEDGKLKEGTRHTMYLKERAVTMEEFYDNGILSLMPEEDVWYEINGVSYIRYKDSMYHLIEPEPYDLENVPAKRAGYKRDLETKGDTFVSPYHDIIPILEKTIKANSELDLTMSLHCFNQKIMMGKRCDNPECNSGYINEITKSGENRHVCPNCNGVGLLIATTTQDVLLLEPSEVREEQLSIDDLVRYVGPSVDLVRFQDEYVESLTWKAKQAMFNSDIFTRKEVSETATGKNIDMQNVYDTLWPFATRYADLWEFYVTIIADLTDMDKGLEILFVFDKDFKMKTTTELYDDLDKANTSGADSFAIQDIQMDIARNIFANNPIEFNKYVVKQDFYPFSGKTKEEIIALKASNNTTRFLKVLEENYSYIFDQIEMSEEKFYLLERTKQWTIIKAKTEELITEIGEPVTEDLSKQFGEKDNE